MPLAECNSLGRLTSLTAQCVLFIPGASHRCTEIRSAIWASPVTRVISGQSVWKQKMSRLCLHGMSWVSREFAAYRASIQVFDPTSLGRLAPNVIQERDPHRIWPGHIEVPGDKPFNKVGRAHARVPHECDCRPAWELAPNNVSSNLIVNRDAPPFQNPELRRAMALSLDREALPK
jgi:hypothetical protein